MVEVVISFKGKDFRQQNIPKSTQLSEIIHMFKMNESTPNLKFMCNKKKVQNNQTVEQVLLPKQRVLKISATEDKPKPTQSHTIIQPKNATSIITVNIDLFTLFKPTSFEIQNDKKLSFLIDMFCKKEKKEPNKFLFYLDSEVDNKPLDPEKSLKELNIKHNSLIHARRKVGVHKKLCFFIEDFESRQIPLTINWSEPFIKLFKKFCESVDIDFDNVIFCLGDKVIDPLTTPYEVEGLKDYAKFNVIERKPMFDVFVENVPNGVDEPDLIDFLPNVPDKIELYVSDEGLPGYARLCYSTRSDAFAAMAKCAQNDLNNHQMNARLQRI